jgi:3-phosphoshikimate 1-carboxyvinyltransferase
MNEHRVRGGAPKRGRVRVPGDKSISHRALLFGALAPGVSTIRGLSPGGDVASTRHAVTQLGASVDGDQVHGGDLHAAAEPIDAGNSGTTMRLLAGVCAARPWQSELQGDESLSRRPMDRVALPLTRMGAEILGGGPGVLPPLVIKGATLTGIDYELPVASAQVKAAILLAGIHADGETIVRERLRTRAHTEEMLARFGADVDVTDDGMTIRVRRSTIEPFEIDVPGDPSQAAFWVVAGLVVPDSEIVVEGVYVGPGRAGFLDVLTRMGADVEVQTRGDGAADIRAHHGALRGTDIGPEEVPSLVDELPVLAVAAAHAEGVTTVRGAGELRVKETDRIATITTELARLGVDIEPIEDGFVVRGPTSRWRAASVGSHGDHRIAMALAVAASAIDGETEITGWDAVGISYPGFGEELAACG